MKNCYFQHDSKESEVFTCFDGENLVCSRCCTEACPVETPDWFLDCSQAGHPTWPAIASNSSVPHKLVCLESYWTNQLFIEKTVKPFLDGLNPLLRNSLAIAHRHIESMAGLKFYTQYPEGLLWKDPLSWDTPLFYLAFHGRPGTIGTVLDAVGPNLLCEAFEGYGGYKTIIYFGACSVFKGQKGRKFADDFLQSSKVNAIVGYTEDVDWMDSMIIDMLFIQRFYNDPDPWANLKDIFYSIVEDYKPAKKFGYIMFHRDAD